jgi:hypothetical protein
MYLLVNIIVNQKLLKIKFADMYIQVCYDKKIREQVLTNLSRQF